MGLGNILGLKRDLIVWLESGGFRDIFSIFFPRIKDQKKTNKIMETRVKYRIDRPHQSRYDVIGSN